MRPDDSRAPNAPTPTSVGLRFFQSAESGAHTQQSVGREYGRSFQHSIRGRLTPIPSLRRGFALVAPAVERSLPIDPATPLHRAMSIKPYLDGIEFDPETLRILDLVMERVSLTLLLERREIPHERIAKAIIKFAQQGERDPVRLRERILQSMAK